MLGQVADGLEWAIGAGQLGQGARRGLNTFQVP